jgi:hypothetical protein
MLAFGPGLQPGCRITREQVRFRVLCVCRRFVENRANNVSYRSLSCLHVIGRAPRGFGCAGVSPECQMMVTSSLRG